MNKTKLGRSVVIAAVLAIVIVGVRALLPWWVAGYINDRLERIGEYRGHVEDVDLSLIRGSYALHGLRLVKPVAETAQPFLTMRQMDVSVQWSALLHGELVGEIRMYDPIVNLIQGENRQRTQLGAGVNWPDQVRKLFPFRFNRIEAENGRFTFRAPGIKTDESLVLADVRFLATNLTNVDESTESAYAGYDLRAKFAENTTLSIAGRFNPNAEQPTFDVNMSIEGARLVDVNPWLRELLNVDAENGRFSMYTELAAAEGRFEGYVKPILEDAEFLRLDEPSANALQKLWEGLVGLVSGLLTNPEEDQVATQVPFSGDFENPDADILATVVNLLRNAFVAAFTHSVEGTISIDEVRTSEDE